VADGLAAEDVVIVDDTMMCQIITVVLQIVKTGGRISSSSSFSYLSFINLEYYFGFGLRCCFST